MCITACGARKVTERASPPREKAGAEADDDAVYADDEVIDGVLDTMKQKKVVDTDDEELAWSLYARGK